MSNIVPVPFAGEVNRLPCNAGHCLPWTRTFDVATRSAYAALVGERAAVQHFMQFEVPRYVVPATHRAFVPFCRTSDMPSDMPSGGQSDRASSANCTLDCCAFAGRTAELRACGDGTGGIGGIGGNGGTRGVVLRTERERQLQGDIYTSIAKKVAAVSGADKF